MARIDAETVQKIANLAHLELSPEDLAYYQGQMAKVLDYMEQLQALDLDLPHDWRAELELPATVEREDKAQESQAIEAVLAAAPKVLGTAFQVPRIIE